MKNAEDSTFLHQQDDSPKASSQKPGISQHGAQCVLKICIEIGQVEDKSFSCLPLLSTANELYLKIISLRNRKKFRKDLT